MPGGSIEQIIAVTAEKGVAAKAADQLVIAVEAKKSAVAASP